jgi:hypothetical protein
MTIPLATPKMLRCEKCSDPLPASLAIRPPCSHVLCPFCAWGDSLQRCPKCGKRNSATGGCSPPRPVDTGMPSAG